MTTPPPDTETKSQFSRRVGVTPGRVSQWIDAGLPLTEDRKRVPVAAALAWLDATLSPHQVLAQRRPKAAPATSCRGFEGISKSGHTPPEGGNDSFPPPPEPPKRYPDSGCRLPEAVADPDPIPSGDYLEARRVHEWAKARRAQLELDRAQGRVVDAEEARQEAFARGRAERDSWQSWVHRIAPILAAELRAAEHAVFVALQREVDDHLEWLADTPFETLGADRGSH